MSWSQENIVAKIHAAVDRCMRVDSQQLHQLHSVLERTPPDVVFAALYSIFLDKSRPHTQFLDQEYAGILLSLLKPSLSVPPEPVGTIRDVLLNYNPSIEQLPYYFADVYGIGTVAAVLEAIPERTLTEQEAVALRAFRFWIRGRQQKV